MKCCDCDNWFDIPSCREDSDIYNMCLIKSNEELKSLGVPVKYAMHHLIFTKHDHYCTDFENKAKKGKFKMNCCGKERVSMDTNNE